MKHLIDYQQDAKRFHLDVIQLPYPPGGYAVSLSTLRIAFKTRRGELIQRAPTLWCRNLHEVGQTIAARPKFSVRRTT